MYLMINGSRTNFDRRSTEVHELGPHARPRALERRLRRRQGRRAVAELESQVPTMHPFSIAGTDRRSLEADDVAALSELYPEPIVHDHHRARSPAPCTRCGTGEPVLGANVRAINVADPTIQLTRVTGFDGEDGRELHDQRRPARRLRRRRRAAGRRRRLPRPPGDVHPHRHRLHAGVPQQVQGGRLRAGHRPQRASESIPVGASGTEPADFKVEGASLALVDRRHRQHGPRDRRHQDRAGGDDHGARGRCRAASRRRRSSRSTTRDDQRRSAATRPAAQRHRRAHDPQHARLPGGLQRGADDRRAAARQRRAGDPRHRRREPSDRPDAGGASTRSTRRRARGCPCCCPAAAPPEQSRGARPPAAARAPAATLRRRRAARARTRRSRPTPSAPRTRCARSARRACSPAACSASSPRSRRGTADANDALLQHARQHRHLGRDRPAVAAVSPSAAPQGTTLDVELTGSNTGFRAGSTVAVGRLGGVGARDRTCCRRPASTCG